MKILYIRFVNYYFNQREINFGYLKGNNPFVLRGIISIEEWENQGGE